MSVHVNRRLVAGLSAATAAAALAGGAPAMAQLPPSQAVYSANVAFPAGATYDHVSLPVDFGVSAVDIFDLDSAHAFTQSDNFGTGPAVTAYTIGSASAAVDLTYFYRINGPVGGSALIGLTGSVYAFGFPYPDPGEAWAGISGSAGLAPGDYYGQACASFDGSCAPGLSSNTVPVNVSFSVPTNTVEWIKLSAAASGADYGSEFTAQADPILFLDPSIGDPQDYSIEVSPDVTNGDPPFVGGGDVPEPAAWAMMLVGFGALGAVIRRRRRAALAA
ncbi:PEPxxWA-CTERM sorting domain-containing protein [Phenylobacterium sp.]|uniref:PEPxxWA-CTERM sorting domain-containing protein n=1 Tax=Phenylobacterium sp. TaxID=1871053 RepID=UPI002CAF3CC8|nr:PEPxxWA-CTERM sorting domain-containing protein [Phenylobacterium sp.]HLZ77522.1 PEPxxWA-CTERM sorting domain-containing protein [Phenylobacterium sp.]